MVDDTQVGQKDARAEDDVLVYFATAIGGGVVAVTLSGVTAHLLGFANVSTSGQVMACGLGAALGVAVEISARLAARRSSRG